jgi:predicted SPOUT superfamily RNA methylase MTH1
METFFIIIISILVTLGLVTIFKQWKSKQMTHAQSILLLDKIKRVSKFITVEGDFAEIYHYEDVKEKFLKLISSRKKALVVINAKAHVGFDLSKIKLKSNLKTKTVVLTHFPQPEVLSIESDINYYDKKDGMFNKFEATDLTELHTKAKEHIREKIPESGLYNLAKQEALEAIQLIENLVETIGWRLDYSDLKIEEEKQKPLLK